MALNIKNADTETAVRELMALTGETQAAAIKAAALERLARLRKSERSERIDRLVHDLQKSVRESGAELSSDFLYDEDGLPS